MSICFGCGKEKVDSLFNYWVWSAKGEERSYCKDCSGGRNNVPDVYWDGKPEENLADDPATGKPRVFLSKGEKAQYLKEHNLMEAGDRVHGAPYQARNFQPKRDTREDVRSALRAVGKMSSDYRRREYLRIINGRKSA